MSTTAEEEATISIPSIAFVAVLGYIIYRYFWSGRGTSPGLSPSGGTSSSSRSRNVPRFTLAQVDQVMSMFPQLNRRDVMWDLQRNGGNVTATTEQVLSGGRLQAAPPTFQPTFPSNTTATTSPNGTNTRSTPSILGMSKTSPPEPDLITRYNLQGRLESKGKEKEEPNHGWAKSKEERQAMLQRRRDEMILTARRKMQEQDGQRSGGGAVGGGTVVAATATANPNTTGL